MFKLQSLMLGLITAMLYIPQSQANIVPDRSTPKFSSREFNARAIRPLKKSTSLKQQKIEKLLKTRKYPEVRIQESSINQFECERLQKLGQAERIPANMSLNTNFDLGGSTSPKCTAEIKLPDPPSTSKK